MSSIPKTAVLFALALALLGVATAHAQDYLTNGDFENGTTGWTKTQGYFDVTGDPDNSSNHIALLRGATGYTSTIQQTFSADPARYALFFSTSYPTNVSCTTTGTVTAGSQSYSVSGPSNSGFLNLDFTVPAGSSSATLTISVTCSGLGRYIRIDDAQVWFTAPLP